MTFYDVAAWMVPVESGLKKNHLRKILELLPEGSELIPFEIHETNSSAYGFATVEVIDEENGLESIVDHLGEVVEDWITDSADYTHTLSSGRKIYMGCDYRTVVIGADEE